MNLLIWYFALPQSVSREAMGAATRPVPVGSIRRALPIEYCTCALCSIIFTHASIRSYQIQAFFRPFNASFIFFLSDLNSRKLMNLFPKIIPPENPIGIWYFRKRIQQFDAGFFLREKIITSSR